MDNLYQKTEQFVIDAWKGNENDILHSKRTVYWVKKLKSEADEALRIAAVSHDIERAFNGDWKKGSDNPGDLRKHQDLSAEEIEKFLKSGNAPEDLIDRVTDLVRHHEEGGNEEQNILCDADCLAVFEYKALRRVKEAKERGVPREEIKRKTDYYFSRFHSEEAKQIAQKYYEAAIEEINK